MQRAKAEDIVAAVERIAADPSGPNNNLRPLKGVPNGFPVFASGIGASRMRSIEIRG